MTNRMSHYLLLSMLHLLLGYRLFIAALKLGRADFEYFQDSKVIKYLAKSIHKPNSSKEPLPGIL